ncbi:uncharacterized protein LOC122264867 [Penaeus japonicus]|uniref:uncharacterized protein LOC122264867 n=1 Tax=Penaeus japonicus TaxID=27405 RepID=UPI001C70D342|nr:uncharacterized protein LOC122264867 [Penaeus japonicus]
MSRSFFFRVFDVILEVCDVCPLCHGVNLKRVKTFKYLWSMVDQTERMEKEVNFRIQCGWNNWRKVSGGICDRRVPVEVERKVHKAVVRPALIYGPEVAPPKKIEERKFDRVEVKMERLYKCRHERKGYRRR